MYIRSLFEANKNVKEPRQQRVGMARKTMNTMANMAIVGFVPGNGGFA